MRKQIILIAAALAVPSVASAGVREELLAIADAVALTGQHSTAVQLEEAVNALSDDELEFVYGEADLAAFEDFFIAGENALDAVDRLNPPGSLPIRDFLASAPLADYRRNRSGLLQIGQPGSSASSVIFPGAVGYPSGGFCGFSPDRSDADTFIAAVDGIRTARVALEGAKVVWSGLSRGCGQTLVVLGAGGNTEVACIPVDIVLFAAEVVVGVLEADVEHTAFCDAAVDAAEIEGSYERVGHVHADLTTHDTDISTQLAVHDTDIKALLGAIQDVVEENQRLLKKGLSRQLEELRLLITPEGQRAINPDVLTCLGEDDCPQVLECPKGGPLRWPCK